MVEEELVDLWYEEDLDRDLCELKEEERLGELWPRGPGVPTSQAPAVVGSLRWHIPLYVRLPLTVA